jgi:isocitrate dehydrogenase
VLKDAIAAGDRIGSIFKEPTITPQDEQVAAMGLSKSYPSPNGAMRAGWNGYTISRDTIMIEGQELGYKKKVFFDRHAVGGEYGAVYGFVEGAGKIVTLFYKDGTSEPQKIAEKQIKDAKSAVVTYDIPLSSIKDQAHHFFSRCLEAGVVPYITTKRTVFKWQSEYWRLAKETYDEFYKERFKAKGVLGYDANGNQNAELNHILTDDATMKLIKWKDGNFGFMALNYDGDMLTDEMGEIHAGNPGLTSSVLIGKAKDGSKIYEFEASHGTMAGSYKRYMAGQLDRVRMQPLGLFYAFVGALKHSTELALARKQIDAATEGAINNFADKLYKAIVQTVRLDESRKELPDYPSLLASVKELL